MAKYKIINSVLGAFFGFSLLVSAVHGQVEPDREGVGQYEFKLPELQINADYRLPDQLPSQSATQAVTGLESLGLPANAGHMDVRSGRWANLRLSYPLIPGKGKDNQLDWTALGLTEPKSKFEIGHAASMEFRALMESASQAFNIDSNEIKDPGKTTVHDGGSLIQIHIPRVFEGVVVRDNYLTASISHGNLALFGANQWGDISTSTEPTVDSVQAQEVVQSFVSAYPITGIWDQTRLELIPLEFNSRAGTTPVGEGYDYRLAWVIHPAFDGDMRHFEALVDAHSGEVISFIDTNQYIESRREIKGGVLPVSNDGVGDDGTEQAGWPMPFDIVTTPDGPSTTDAGGNVTGFIDGDVTSTLSGKYVNIFDNCGPISLTSAGNIDFGTSAGTDCATPGFGGAGNTHAARTGFHELSRIIEMGQSHLPGNGWLQQQLTSNMNINQTCNAFWGGGTVNFYRSGGGCFNTGEIAGVFDHEWGHGLDANDAIPGIAGPSGEGIADIYAALRLNTSCIGRNFRASVCSGFGDPCLSCTGVRDIDYLQRVSGLPHTFSWSNANCAGSVHCVGSVYAEALWSLWKRGLQSAPYNLDDHTAHEIVTRLTFIGGGNTGTWFSGAPPEGGCAANSGYMNYLMADDDNGDLSDGTPHMQAIYDAFNDQEIACSIPVVQDSGCGAAPVNAPNVSIVGKDQSAELSWNPVNKASTYDVFRTDGVHGCDFGKTKVGTTSGLSFSDSGLQNGRDYFYVVIPKGTSDACFGPASGCAAVTPVEGVNLGVDESSMAVSISTGDADEFVDNCEDTSVTFDVNSTGIGDQTNVRIVNIKSISHPGSIVSTGFPLAVTPAALLQGETGSAGFSFTAAFLDYGDDLVFKVWFTSDELFPAVKTQTLTIPAVESDTTFYPVKSWGFESDNDGWTLANGTFNQTTVGGGANGTAGYIASSDGLGDQCDQLRSPYLQLSGTSTMTMWSNYDIEGMDTQWWDRANVAFLEDGGRNAVSPDGGRPYDATGAGASCVTTGQDGYAGTNDSWALSSWSATALDSAGRAGDLTRIDIAYGTDGAVHGRGFWFDQVRLTDVTILGADAQSNSCPGENQDPDGDGLTSLEEFNINPLLDPNNPDTDGDGIQDNLDTLPVLFSNLCYGVNPNPQLNAVISDVSQCAGTNSITVKGPTKILSNGDLELISPTISFENGFGADGVLRLKNIDPCPACSP